ncbi:MAG: YkgJ family cysteine cluster protein [Candidatus Hodarchaeota archaeon]
MNFLDYTEKRFHCQQSGHCCVNPKIIVTLTYRDIFRLYMIQDYNFEKLLQKISFYTLEESLVNIVREQMVLEPIQTSQGKIIPGLRKLKGGSCIFYNHPNCSIYSNRPLACMNYPFTFIKEKDAIVSVWAKNALKSCPGIGKGPPISSEKIKRLGERLIEEIQLQNQVVENLNIEALEGRPLTAREALWIFVIYGEKEKK